MYSNRWIGCLIVVLLSSVECMARWIFPDDELYNQRKFFSEPLRPKCVDGGNGQVYCTRVINYPAQYVKKILDSKREKYETFFGEDLVQESANISQRFSGTPQVQEQKLCGSDERVIYPQVGLTKNQQWRLIINQPNYNQGIRIEQCINSGSVCAFTDSFPNGYQTECQQKFSYRQLLSINQDGKVVKDFFKFPSCCACIVKSYT